MTAVPKYWLDDLAQQVLGGFLLAGPFVVTEEVWRLARHMTTVHTGIAIGIVFLVGYGALYNAPGDRDPEKEARFGVLPLRFLSLIAVAYGAVTLLVFLFMAPTTFEAGVGTTVKAISVSAIFSVLGAATADSLF